MYGLYDTGPALGVIQHFILFTFLLHIAQNDDVVLTAFPVLK